MEEYPKCGRLLLAIWLLSFSAVCAAQRAAPHVYEAPRIERRPEYRERDRVDPMHPYASGGSMSRPPETVYDIARRRAEQSERQRLIGQHALETGDLVTARKAFLSAAPFGDIREQLKTTDERILGDIKKSVAVKNWKKCWQLWTLYDERTALPVRSKAASLARVASLAVVEEARSKMAVGKWEEVREIVGPFRQARLLILENAAFGTDDSSDALWSNIIARKANKTATPDRWGDLSGLFQPSIPEQPVPPAQAVKPPSPALDAQAKYARYTRSVSASADSYYGEATINLGRQAFRNGNIDRAAEFMAEVASVAPAQLHEPGKAKLYRSVLLEKLLADYDRRKWSEADATSAKLLSGEFFRLSGADYRAVMTTKRRIVNHTDTDELDGKFLVIDFISPREDRTNDVNDRMNSYFHIFQNNSKLDLLIPASSVQELTAAKEFKSVGVTVGAATDVLFGAEISSRSDIDSSLRQHFSTSVIWSDPYFADATAVMKRLAETRIKESDLAIALLLPKTTSSCRICV